jgi:hypothetical protein
LEINICPLVGYVSMFYRILDNDLEFEGRGVEIRG